MIVQVDFTSDKPLYTQLYDQFVMGMASDQLLPGEELPSVRRLAADIGINIHTVNKAYALLRDQGYIQMDRRSGARIRDSLPVITDPAAFAQRLSDQLRPLAAEAVCHGYDIEQFSQISAAVLKDIRSAGHPDSHQG